MSYFFLILFIENDVFFIFIDVFFIFIENDIFSINDGENETSFERRKVGPSIQVIISKEKYRLMTNTQDIAERAIKHASLES